MKWLETADIKLGSLGIKRWKKGASSIRDASHQPVPPAVLARNAGTLEVLHGLVFILRPGDDPSDPASEPEQDIHVARCDLTGFPQLYSLSVYTDHQMDLRLPPTLEELHIVLTVHNRFWDGFKAAWSDDDSDASSVESKEHPLGTDPQQPAPHPLEWAAAARDSEATGPTSSHPTWATFLRGATGLRTLMVSWISHADNLKMFLEDFRREWPQGLRLRELTARNVFVPFELAVRDAEMLHFDSTGMFLCSVDTAEEVLEAVLAGRARKLWFTAANAFRFFWMGPMSRGRSSNLRVVFAMLPDLKAAAASPQFASRIRVEELGCCKGEAVSTLFTVLERWPEGDMEGCGGPLPNSWQGAMEEPEAFGESEE